MLNFVLLFLIL